MSIEKSTMAEVRFQRGLVTETRAAWRRSNDEQSQGLGLKPEAQNPSI